MTIRTCILPCLRLCAANAIIGIGAGVLLRGAESTITLPAAQTNEHYDSPASVSQGTVFDASQWISTAVGPEPGTTSVAAEIGPRDSAPGVNHATGVTNVIWSGGVVIGQTSPTWSWRRTHDDKQAGGAGVIIHNQGFAEFRFLRAHNVEDGVKPREAPEWSNGASFRVRDCYFTAIRDDCIENDRFEPGIVEDCLFDGVHTFLSEQKERGFLNGGGAPISIGPKEDDTIQVKRVYVRLYPTNAFDAADDRFPGPGKWFKWSGDADGQPAPTAPNHKVVVEDSIFAVGAVPRSGWKNLWIPEKVRWSGANNFILWLGQPGEYRGPRPAGVTFLEGAVAEAKWREVRNEWLVRHGLPSQGLLPADYNPHSLRDFPPVSPAADTK